MKKYLLFGGIGLAFAVALIAFIVFGKPSPRGPRLEISEDAWDFGKAKAGSSLRHSFIIENNGDAALSVNAYPSCPACMYISLEKTEIPPLGQSQMLVRMTITSPERYEGFISLDSNDPERPRKIIPVTGTLSR